MGGNQVMSLSLPSSLSQINKNVSSGEDKTNTQAVFSEAGRERENRK